MYVYIHTYTCVCSGGEKDLQDVTCIFIFVHVFSSDCYLQCRSIFLFQSRLSHTSSPLQLELIGPFTIRPGGNRITS